MACRPSAHRVRRLGLTALVAVAAAIAAYSCSAFAPMIKVRGLRLLRWAARTMRAGFAAWRRKTTGVVETSTDGHAGLGEDLGAVEIRLPGGVRDHIRVRDRRQNVLHRRAPGHEGPPQASYFDLADMRQSLIRTAHNTRILTPSTVAAHANLQPQRAISSGSKLLRSEQRVLHIAISCLFCDQHKRRYHAVSQRLGG